MRLTCNARARVALIVVSFAMVVAGVADAQPRRNSSAPDTMAQQAAALHMRNGQQAFAARRFDAAAREFEEAFELSHEPSLLFNAGAAWEQFPDPTRALEAYRRYLEAVPNAPNRPDVEVRIAVIERTQHANQASVAPGAQPAGGSTSSATPTTTGGASATSQSDASASPTQDTSHRTPDHPAQTARSSTPLIIGIAAAVLAIGAGAAATGLYLSAQSDFSHYQSGGCTPGQCSSIADGIDQRILATNILIPTAGVLGAAAIAAVVVYFMTPGEHPQTSVAAIPLSNGALGVITRSF